MPCSHGNRTPRELYEQALECWQDKCITVFGRTAEEILLALTCYDDCLMMKKQEQKPMTREEAERKVAKACGVPVSATGSGNIVTALEALGLLKFDEAPKKVEPEVCNGESEMLDVIIKALKKAGYRIYKGGYGREL